MASPLLAALLVGTSSAQDVPLPRVLVRVEQYLVHGKAKLDLPELFSYAKPNTVAAFSFRESPGKEPSIIAMAKEEHLQRGVRQLRTDGAVRLISVEKTYAVGGVSGRLKGRTDDGSFVLQARVRPMFHKQATLAVSVGPWNGKSPATAPPNEWWFQEEVFHWDIREGLLPRGVILSLPNKRLLFVIRVEESPEPVVSSGIGGANPTNCGH